MGKSSKTYVPPPDPAIGQAAVMSAELGNRWLDFTEEQHKAGSVRQDAYDAIINKVVNNQLATEKQATQWASEDRNIQAGIRDKFMGLAEEDRKTQADYRQKFDKWGDEDRAAGRKTIGDMDRYAEQALATGWDYEKSFGDVSRGQYAFADEQQARYRDRFRPIEDRIAQDAMTWDSEERQQAEAGKAKADVIRNAEQQQAANRRQMASMGVDPRSGRFAGVDRATSLDTALAAAGAENTARDTIRQQGLALRGQAAQVGQSVQQMGAQARSMGMQARGAALAANTGAKAQAMQAKNLGLAAAGIGNSSASLGIGNQSAGNGNVAVSQQGAGYTGLGLGLNAGQAAIGGMGAGNANFFQNNAGMNAGFGGAMQGYANQGNILNAQYGNQLQAWGMQNQANAQSSAGMGSAFGTIVGAGITAF
jgi:hypothetical protein